MPDDFPQYTPERPMPFADAVAMLKPPAREIRIFYRAVEVDGPDLEALEHYATLAARLGAALWEVENWSSGKLDPTLTARWPELYPYVWHLPAASLGLTHATDCEVADWPLSPIGPAMAFCIESIRRSAEVVETWCGEEVRHA